MVSQRGIWNLSNNVVSTRPNNRSILGLSAPMQKSSLGNHG